MKKLALVLAVLAVAPAATAFAQTNPAPASWQGPRTSGHGVMFLNSGQGVTLQDAGTAPITFGQLKLLGPSTYSGNGHSPSDMGIYMDIPSITGTCTQTGPGNDTYCDLNRLAVESDQINPANARPVYLLSLVHNLGGGAASGSFGGLSVTTQATGAVAGANPGIEGAQFIVNANANFGGAPGTENGSVWGINTNVVLAASATSFKQVIGDETDIAAVTGSSVINLDGIEVVLTPSHTSAATTENSGLVVTAGQKTISNGGTVAGLTMGLAFGGNSGYFPFNSSATLIGTFCHTNNCGSFPPGTVTHGIDFSPITFSSDAFKSNGFRVDGSGNITAPTLQTTSGPLGLGTVSGVQVQVVDIASPVNLIRLTGAPTGGSPLIAVGGASSDANGNLNFSVRGTGNYLFYSQAATSGATNKQFIISQITNAVDQISVQGGVAGSPGVVSVIATGSDTDVSIALVPKGAGVVKIGSTAGVACSGTPTASFASIGGIVTHC